MIEQGKLEYLHDIYNRAAEFFWLADAELVFNYWKLSFKVVCYLQNLAFGATNRETPKASLLPANASSAFCFTLLWSPTKPSVFSFIYSGKPLKIFLVRQTLNRTDEFLSWRIMSLQWNSDIRAALGSEFSASISDVFFYPI